MAKAGSGFALGERYARDGYAVAEGLFGREEAEAMKAEAVRVLDGLEAEGWTDFKRHGVWVGMSQRSGLFRKLAADPRLAAPLGAILGPRVRFLSDKVVFKSADMSYGSPWHQDWPYWKGDHKLSVWIALDDATPRNGCLKLLPGTHREVFVHDGEASDGRGFANRLKPDAVDEGRAVSVPAAAGTAIFFHDLLLHASHPNESGEDRWTLIGTYRDGRGPDETDAWPGSFLMDEASKVAG